MDYKAVIEEQIQKLQEAQERIHPDYVDLKVSLAKAIASLSIDANNLYVQEG